MKKHLLWLIISITFFQPLIAQETLQSVTDRGSTTTANLTTGNLYMDRASNTLNSNTEFIKATLSNYPTWGVSLSHNTENDGYNSYGLGFNTTESYLIGRQEKMRLSSYGNLGIGTNTFNWAIGNRKVLEINGNSQALIGFKIGDVPKSYLYHEGANFYITNEASGKIYFQSLGGYSFNSQVNIPSQVNIVYGTIGGTGIGQYHNTSTDNLTFYNASGGANLIELNRTTGNFNIAGSAFSNKFRGINNAGSWISGEFGSNAGGNVVVVGDLEGKATIGGS
ncbi:hypothetical protein [Pedobacter alpinus]|uniref:Curlin associated repeat-containing protein n=1 Tax=Pedobacter alpinus TaxID=1590643 RepID=A0ABW5TMR1_9SPHI